MNSPPGRTGGSELRRWLDKLPKAELHLHLEGAIPLDALWALIQKYGGDPSVPTETHLRQRLTYSDFPDFIETWIWKNSFLQTYDDFSFIAEKSHRTSCDKIFFMRSSSFRHLGSLTEG